MQIELIDHHIAIIQSKDLLISKPEDAVELLANCGYQGAEAIILEEKNIHPDLFNLKTGLAGEVFQKFSNYKMRLAIVLDHSHYTSKSLKDFIFESNKTGKINFVESMDKAKEVLTKR